MLKAIVLTSLLTFGDICLPLGSTTDIEITEIKYLIVPYTETPRLEITFMGSGRSDLEIEVRDIDDKTIIDTFSYPNEPRNGSSGIYEFSNFVSEKQKYIVHVKFDDQSTVFAVSSQRHEEYYITVDDIVDLKAPEHGFKEDTSREAIIGERRYWTIVNRKPGFKSQDIKSIFEFSNVYADLDFSNFTDEDEIPPFLPQNRIFDLRKYQIGVTENVKEEDIGEAYLQIEVADEENKPFGDEFYDGEYCVVDLQPRIRDNILTFELAPKYVFDIMFSDMKKAEENYEGYFLKYPIISPAYDKTNNLESVILSFTHTLGDIVMFEVELENIPIDKDIFGRRGTSLYSVETHPPLENVTYAEENEAIYP